MCARISLSSPTEKLSQSTSTAISPSSQASYHRTDLTVRPLDCRKCQAPQPPAGLHSRLRPASAALSPLGLCPLFLDFLLHLPVLKLLGLCESHHASWLLPLSQGSWTGQPSKSCQGSLGLWRTQEGCSRPNLCPGLICVRCPFG